MVLVTDGKQVGIGVRGIFGRTKEQDKRVIYKHQRTPIFFRPVLWDPLPNIVAWKHMPAVPSIKTMEQEEIDFIKKNLFKVGKMKYKKRKQKEGVKEVCEEEKSEICEISSINR